ncbi:MAG TPA: glycosyltransferase family 2 protein [Candidatus Omnitrophota bacterium]|nr:glycosyltransferase family 2 protein [Candidatus Omnitrophota bacterium]
MKKLVSVIISTYNRAELLPRAIESVLRQTYSTFELIIVDDGSTDHTRQVVAEFVSRDDRIRYFYIDHKGSARAKNYAIGKASGVYVGMLDSDDEWFDMKLETQLNIFEGSNNPKLGCVGCGSQVVDLINGRTYNQGIILRENVLKQILSKDCMGSGSNMLYKADILKKIGLFDEHLTSGSDWELRIRLAQAADFIFSEKILLVYYIHRQNLTNSISLVNKKLDYNYIYTKWQSLYIAHKEASSNMEVRLGVINVRLKKWEEAFGNFIKAIKKNPINGKCYVYLVIIAFYISKNAVADIVKMR